MNSVCLAILNYNGRKHLEHLLPTAIAAAKKSPVPCSVLVLDNRSPNADVDWVRQNFPTVKTLVAPENDFLFSYNWLLAELPDNVVVLLNNDLRLAENFLPPLLRHLENPDVFAASASSYDWDGTEFTSGPATLQLKDGFYGWPFDVRRQETCHTLFCSGACMAVDRKKFLEIGGFNRLFHPAYCEDLDLCFRAWRRGWRCVYEPASVVWHRENASWSLECDSRPGQLNLKNSLLFQWSTLPTDNCRWARRWAMLKIILGFAVRGNFTWLKNLLAAAKTWRQTGERYRDLKVSPAELEKIQARIAARP
jgi:N-acetylglucosaminyl-diphospho-decaprenol L-rhamnosyltransferase